MSVILEQLELNGTFFYQIAIFAILFLFLKYVYFRPFMKLFKARHQKTVADQEAAEKLMAQADAKFEEYKARIAAERQAAKKDYEALILEARKEEASLLASAREQAKKITHEAAESIVRQHEQLKKQLEADVEALAKTISEKLISRKV